MATATLFLDGTTAQGSWSGNHTTIDEGIAAQDGDSTVSDIGSTGSSLIVTCQNAVDSGTYTDIQIRAHARHTGGPGAEIEFVPRISGSEVGARHGTGALTGSFVTYDFTWSGSWSLADINTLELLFNKTAGASIGRLTAAEAIVTYTVASGFLAQARHFGTLTAQGWQHHPLGTENLFSRSLRVARGIFVCRHGRVLRTS